MGAPLTPDLSAKFENTLVAAVDSRAAFSELFSVQSRAEKIAFGLRGAFGFLAREDCLPVLALFESAPKMHKSLKAAFDILHGDITSLPKQELIGYWLGHFIDQRPSPGWH